MKIIEISNENRPRERLMLNGVSVLSDAELLAVVVKSGCKGSNAVDMSNKLISKFGISKLSELSLRELTTIKGIGKVKACQILALFEFVRRCDIGKVKGKIIKDAKDVYDYAKNRLLHKDREQFMVIMLDIKNRVIKDEIVSIGTLNSAIVHPREVFKSAIKCSANSVVLVHNHPSGDSTFSVEDEEVNSRMKECGEMLGVKVLDNVVI